LLLAVLLALPESLPAPLRQPARPRRVARSLAGLARDGRYLRYVLAAALMFAATFAYISGSSFVLQQDYGLTAQQFSLVFAVNGPGIVLLGHASGYLVGRAATERTLLRVSLAAASLGGLGVLVCAALGLPLPLLLACLFVVVSMLGVVLPNATSLAMAGHRSAAGAASSLQGLLQFGIGGLAASAMGLAGQGTAVPMAATMVACAAVTGGMWCCHRARAGPDRSSAERGLEGEFGRLPGPGPAAAQPHPARDQQPDAADLAELSWPGGW
jgi:MFS transporter, DHA1 family, multidrug resistance protein